MSSALDTWNTRFHNPPNKLPYTVIMSELVKFDPDWAIQQIANGAFLKDISAMTGIDKRRLSEQLRKHPDYPAAKEAAIEVQLDDAQQAIDTAQDTTDIARARERFRAAAWRAEREASHRWGVKSEVTHRLPDGPMLQINLSSHQSGATLGATVIDGDAKLVDNQ